MESEFRNEMQNVNKDFECEYDMWTITPAQDFMRGITKVYSKTKKPIARGRAVEIGLKEHSDRVLSQEQMMFVLDCCLKHGLINKEDGGVAPRKDIVELYEAQKRSK